MAEETKIEFVPGSKLVIVAGGYHGGQESKGIVLRTYTDEWGDFVEVAFYEVHCEEVCYVESLVRRNLEDDLRQGRREGSLKRTYMTRPDGVVYGE